MLTQRRGQESSVCEHPCMQQETVSLTDDLLSISVNQVFKRNPLIVATLLHLITAFILIGYSTRALCFIIKTKWRKTNVCTADKLRQTFSGCWRGHGEQSDTLIPHSMPPPPFSFYSLPTHPYALDSLSRLTCHLFYHSWSCSFHYGDCAWVVIPKAWNQR